MSNSPSSTVTLNGALALLAECFNLPVGEVHADLERDAIADWDSMGALMLMAELDERFGIVLTADASRELQRIADVLIFLRGHGVLRDEA
jgi:acyl carrier protein